MKNNIIRKGPKGMHGKSSKFIKIQANSHVDLIPLVEMDNLISVDQHTIWQDTGSSPTFVCLGDGCPGCTIGHEPASKSFLPVYSVGDRAPKIFSFGKSIGDALLEIGNIKGKVIRVKRKGEGLKTKYTVIPLGKKVNVGSITAPDIEKELPIFKKSKVVSLLEEAGLWDGEVEDEDESPKRQVVKKNLRKELDDDDENDE